MRNPILCATLVLALAGVAVALPTGPGGTFYFDVNQTSSGGLIQSQTLFYVDVDSNWHPLVTTNACVQFATVDDYYAPNANANSSYGGQHTVWPYGTPMTSYHSADLLLSARYDNSPDPQSVNQNPTNADLWGADLLKLSSTGVVTILNDGFNGPGTSNQSLHHSEAKWAIAIDSGFTPDGSAAGIASQGRYGRGLWVDSDANTYVDDGTFPPSALCWANNSTNMPKYLKTSQTVHYYSAITASTGKPVDPNNYVDKTATGVIFDTNSQNIVATWHFTDGTYQNIKYYTSDHTGNYVIEYTGGGAPYTMGDTNGDGILDVYYPTYVNTAPADPANNNIHRLAHGQDGNADGDWFDAGETWDMGVTATKSGPGFSSGLKDFMVIDTGITPGGWSHDQWILVWWEFSAASTSQSWLLKGITLDQYGDWDKNPSENILVYTITSTGVQTGDSSFALVPLGTSSGFAARNLVFSPLVQGQEEIPEPATLLLVGTGVLGLAGVLRRRLLS